MCKHTFSGPTIYCYKNKNIKKYICMFCKEYERYCYSYISNEYNLVDSNQTWWWVDEKSKTNKKKNI